MLTTAPKHSTTGTASLGEDASAAGLDAIFIAHRDRLLRFLIARVRDRTEAEEIVQEAYLRISAIRSGPIADPISYLHRLALNLVIDRQRQRVRRAKREDAWSEANMTRLGEDLLDERPSPWDDLIDRERARRLEEAIASMPPAARRAFRLHKGDGLSHREVAERLGISRKGVEKHMATAFRHLARELRE